MKDRLVFQRCGAAQCYTVYTVQWKQRTILYSTVKYTHIFTRFLTIFLLLKSCNLGPRQKPLRKIFLSQSSKNAFPHSQMLRGQAIFSSDTAIFIFLDYCYWMHCLYYCYCNIPVVKTTQIRFFQLPFIYLSIYYKSFFQIKYHPYLQC